MPKLNPCRTNPEHKKARTPDGTRLCGHATERMQNKIGQNVGPDIFYAFDRYFLNTGHRGSCTLICQIKTPGHDLILSYPAPYREDGFSPCTLLSTTGFFGSYSVHFFRKNAGLIIIKPYDDSRSLLSMDSDSLSPMPNENVTDEYLDTLPAQYAASAKLAAEARVDGVDVKSCHGYLFQDLLSAFFQRRALRRQF